MKTSVKDPRYKQAYYPYYNSELHKAPVEYSKNVMNKQ